MTALADATHQTRRHGGISAAGPQPRRLSRWYSRYVGAMKVLLPLAALGIAAVLIGWQSLYPSGQRARASTERSTSEELARTQMVNPRFSGIDDHGQPFVVAADLALPSQRSPAVTDLAKPRGEMTLANGRTVTLTAQRGAYEREARYLDLAGDVTLTDDQGHRLITASARIDAANSRAEGSDAVQGSGPAGELFGEGFRIEDRGMRLIITGQSRLILRGGEEAPPPAVAAQPEPPAIQPDPVVAPQPIAAPVRQVQRPSSTTQRRVQQRRAEAGAQRRSQRPRQDRTR